MTPPNAPCPLLAERVIDLPEVAAKLPFDAVLSLPVPLPGAIAFHAWPFHGKPGGAKHVHPPILRIDINVPDLALRQIQTIDAPDARSQHLPSPRLAPLTRTQTTAHRQRLDRLSLQAADALPSAPIPPDLLRDWGIHFSLLLEDGMFEWYHRLHPEWFERIRSIPS